MKRYAILLSLLLLAGFGCAKTAKPPAKPTAAAQPAAGAKPGVDGKDVDTDGDGLSDRDEVEIYQTNPLEKDTDRDGVSDGDEVKRGDNPNGPGKLVVHEAPKP